MKKYFVLEPDHCGYSFLEEFDLEEFIPEYARMIKQHMIPGSIFYLADRTCIMCIDTRLSIYAK